MIRGTCHPQVNKGEGLRRMCSRLGVPLEQVVAFGDGDNDIEFVQAAGRGVAMANARPTLREVADRVTARTHDEDGVAHELLRMELAGSSAHDWLIDGLMIDSYAR